MQFTSAIAIAVLSYTAAAFANPEAYCPAGMPCPMKRDAAPEAQPWCEYVGQVCSRKVQSDAEAVCGSDGQPCHKVKRAAMAFASAIAEPAPQPWCEYVGQVCNKTRREAEAEAACYLEGGACLKAKREAYAHAAAISDALPAAEAEAFYRETSLALRAAFPEPEAIPGMSSSFYITLARRIITNIITEAQISEDAKRDANAWCEYVGQVCNKVKRAASAMADVLAASTPQPGCKYGGRVCGKTRRDAEANAEALCFSESGPCSMAKRSADALAKAAENTINMF